MGLRVRKQTIKSLQCRLVLAFAALGAAASGLNAQTQSAPAAAESQFSAGDSNSNQSGATASADQRAWKIKPRIGVDVTVTDNATLTPGGASDTIIRTSPGVAIQGNSARIKGTLDLQLNHQDYLNDRNTDRVTRQINGRGTVELVDNWLYLDGGVLVSQQSVSAFGVQAPNASFSPTANQIETRTYQLAPYIKGRLKDIADYQVRLDTSSTSFGSGTAGAVASSSDTMSLTTSLTGDTAFAKLGWGFNSLLTKTDYPSRSISNEMGTMRARLYYSVNPQLKFSVIAGRETNNFLGATNTSSSISGMGVEWNPTPRTRFSLDMEDRYFGTGHKLQLSHRTAKSLWQIGSTRDIQLRPPQVASIGNVTWGDQVTAICSQFTDPLDKATCEAVLLTLRSPTAVTASINSLMSAASDVKSQNASMSLFGVRNSLNLTMMRSEMKQVGIDVPVGDFALASNIRTNTAMLNWSHKLTSLSSLNLSTSRINSQGTGGSSLTSTQTTHQLTLTSKVGPKTNASVGVRKSQLDRNNGAGYDERAFIGTLTHQF